MMNIKGILVCATAMAAIAHGSVHAQPIVGDDQAAAPLQSTFALEEIVVTAQKRSENLQAVPIAITAITASRLASAGISNSQDLTIATPSLSVASAVGYFQPRIRGVGTTANGPGIENPVAVYIDGVYIASAPASLFSFNNIERVEVLKGPQGTLFGRNATGGLIQVITRDPGPGLSGSLNVGYGNYKTFTGNAYLAAGLAEGLAADLAVQASSQGDGFGTNFATGGDANRTNHDIAIRSKLLIEPAEGTKIRISGDYSDVKGSVPYLRAWNGDVPVFGAPAPGDAWDSNSDTPTRNRSKSGGASLNIQQELGFATLTGITAYREARFDTQFDYDLTPTPALGIFITQRDRQFSQELQLGSLPGAPLTWVLGGYYFRATSSYDPIDVVQSGPLIDPAFPLSTIRTHGTQKTRSYAAFGQVTAPLGDATNLTGGLRYTSEKRIISGTVTGFLVGGIPIGNLAPPVDNDATFNKLTWRASLDHKIGDVMLYASYNRGFKSGGFNPQILGAPGYKPEVIDAYETGLKATLLDGRLRFNPSIFYYDYKNLQVPFFTGTGQLGIVNGPSAKVYGLDLDFEFAATRQLRLYGGVTMMHDRFGSYPDAVFNMRQPVGNLQITGDATHNRLPFTSDWSASIAADYTIELTSLGDLGLNVSYNHNDGFFAEADNLRRQKAFDLVNASVSLTPAGTALTARLWIKNILNEDVILQLAAAPQVTAASYQPPRTYGVSLGLKF